MMVSEEEQALRDNLLPSLLDIVGSIHPTVDLSDGPTRDALARALGMGLSCGVLYGETDITATPQTRYEQMWEKLEARWNINRSKQ